MSSNQAVNKIFALIKENNIKFVDFRFCDYNGKWLHISHCADQVSEDALLTGVSFDGSSVANWKPINESDMTLLPDLSTAFVDPFTVAETLVIICDIIEPRDGKRYSRDPRNTAYKAEEYLKSTGIGDVAYFGPEPEFFIFDDVRFETTMNGNFYKINSEELPAGSSKKEEGGNLARRSFPKEAYFDCAPLDAAGDIRAEMTETLRLVGIKPALHHHEVANAQQEIGFQYGSLVETGDNLQKFKYVIHNVAQGYGKTATFMPKPIWNDNGSGMHVHQSIWKDGKNLFKGKEHANLSETALYYIGGIIKHAKAINAFANPTTNSYKRLIPGFEAPVMLAYSSCNRSASIRIPHVSNENARRIEARFPDPTGNPYLTFAAMMMAGIDGIKNKIHPGEPRNQDLYHLSDRELKRIPTVAGSLREALKALKRDNKFLLEGGVFTSDQIEAYIDLKMKEVERYEHVPHPIEFEMYYNR